MGAYEPRPIGLPSLPRPSPLTRFRLVSSQHAWLDSAFSGSLVALFRPGAETAAETLAVRHQLGILLRSRPARPGSEEARSTEAPIRLFRHAMGLWRSSRGSAPGPPRPPSASGRTRIRGGRRGGADRGTGDPP